MRFVIVTGMSGAGKSTALKMLEDAEYFCVDNLPIPLVEKFAQLTADGTSGEIQKVAVGIDIRSGQALPDLQNVLEWMSINGICYEILFLDASDDVLVKRYKETRRTHPLAGLGRVDEGIRKERKALEFLKKDADYILDTSQLLTRELKAELDKIFVQDQKFKNLMITVLSFGFKYGIPADSDLVFDVRFLPNPYYVEGMRPLSGNDAPVRDYVMGFETAQRNIIFPMQSSFCLRTEERSEHSRLSAVIRFWVQMIRLSLNSLTKLQEQRVTAVNCSVNHW